MSIHEVLEKEGISETAVLREHALFVALTKRSYYESVCRRFSKKYNCSFFELKQSYDSKLNHEDFELSDALMEWEFAEKALVWWSARIEEVRLVA